MAVSRAARTCRAVSFGLLGAWTLFEAHLSQMQHGARRPVETHLLVRRKAEHVKRLLQGVRDVISGADQVNQTYAFC